MRGFYLVFGSLGVAVLCAGLALAGCTSGGSSAGASGGASSSGGSGGAASARPFAACADLPASERIALLVGTEGNGLSPAALEASRARARIPMAPGADSLNAAVATAVALYGLTASRSSCVEASEARR